MVMPDEVRQRVVSYMQYQGKKKSRDGLVEMVRTSQDRYIDVIGALDDEMAAKKPAPDEWSVRELTLHVISAQASVADIIARTSRGEPPSPPKEGQPRGAGMSQPDAGRPFAELVDELRTMNATTIAAIESMPETPDTSITPPHPFFGQLNCREWAVFQRVHDEDHIQHAGKILAAVS
jgi:hypothetical protein